MATIEQCRDRLKERLQSRENVRTFCGKFDFPWQSGPAGAGEEGFVSHNIKFIVDDAHHKGRLDELGMALGYPSDAERKRRDTQAAIRRSWVAVGISAVALLVSILVAILKK